MENNNIHLTDRLLKAEDVQDILQLSRSGFYAAIRAGLLPKPIKIGKAARWKASVISSVIEHWGS